MTVGFLDLPPAKQYLRMAEQEIESNGINVGAFASMATAHAVLALIDIIQGDREEEIAELQHHIIQLEADLQAARTALHVREQVTAAEMKKLKWGPPNG